MIRAYYTASNGAKSSQNYLDVLSNNVANIQTDGFKKSKAEFSDLLYTSRQGTSDEIQTGSGSKMGRVDTIFDQGTLYATERETDFAIEGDGFFMIQIDDTNYFTRGGNFEIANIDDANYLMYQGGFVLDENEDPILFEKDADKINVGVFVVSNTDLKRSGNNLFELSNEDAEYSLSENSRVLRGYLEASGVELSEEMVKLIEIQRSFQLNSKVIQTADEIEQTINSLRN
jgi:flagellar basal body rod protein FlgG